MSLSGKLFKTSAADVTTARMAQAEAIKARFDNVVGELAEFINDSITAAGVNAELELGDRQIDTETSGYQQILSLKFGEEMALEIDVSVFLDSVYREITQMEEAKQAVDVAAAVDKSLLAGPFIRCKGDALAVQYDSWFPRLLADENKGRFEREDYELGDEDDRQDLLEAIGRAIAHNKTFTMKQAPGLQPR